MRLVNAVKMDLTLKRDKLELELERIINNPDIETGVKIDKSKELLCELSQTINSIELWQHYADRTNNQNESK
jgi:hypothetical protein|tara:strand:+ start:5582 stop:5797 length:216 start_codon:yes stop_codon:yes gene_type:complete